MTRSLGGGERDEEQDGSFHLGRQQVPLPSVVAIVSSVEDMRRHMAVTLVVHRRCKVKDKMVSASSKSAIKTVPAVVFMEVNSPPSEYRFAAEAWTTAFTTWKMWSSSTCTKYERSWERV